MRFADLGLHPALLANLKREGYEAPTPIQARAIPALLEGRDLLGLAQTGTGKTAAFALPVLQHLAEDPPRGKRRPRALVLTPTRELAGQVNERFGVYGKAMGLKSTVIFGGIGQGQQVAALRSGIDILVATPGRLLDLHGQGDIDLRGTSVLVLDEADRMLDMGFIKPLQQIIAKLPPKRHNLLFSATMPDPIRKLAGDLLTDPVEVRVAPKVATTPLVDQYVSFVPQKLKVSLLAQVLRQPDAERVIVFTRTKRGADRVAKKLGQVDLPAAVIHGNKSQNARVRALNGFKDGDVRILVATDVAARGIDVERITHVVNYDLPNEPESYVHRIGRTGRAGATGLALSFCDQEERAYLADIEKLTKKKLAIVPLPQDLAAAASELAAQPPEPKSAPRRRAPASRPARSPARRRSARAG